MTPKAGHFLGPPEALSVFRRLIDTDTLSYALPIEAELNLAHQGRINLAVAVFRDSRNDFHEAKRGAPEGTPQV